MNHSNEETYYFSETDVDYNKIIAKYLQYKYWFLGTILVFVLGAFFYLRHTPSTFRSAASIKLLTEAESTIPSLADMSPFSNNEINHENEIEILSSYRLMKRVVQKMNLTRRFARVERFKTVEIENLPFDFEQKIHPDNIGHDMLFEVRINPGGLVVKDFLNNETPEQAFKNFSTRSRTHSLPFEIEIPASERKKLLEKSEKHSFQIAFSSVHTAALSLQNQITVKRVGNYSDIMELSLTGVLKEKNEQILNTLIESYNEDGVKDKQMVDQFTIDFINQRFVSLKKELDAIEERKKEFKQKNELIDLEFDVPMSLTDQGRTNFGVFELENQELLIKMLRESLQRKNSDLLPANIGLENSTVNDIVDRYNAVALERNKLSKSGGVNNPNVQLMDSSLKEMRDNLVRSLDDFSGQIQASKKQWILRNETFDANVAALPSLEKQLREIERSLKTKENLYLFLLEKREAAAIQLAVTEPIVKIVDYALTSQYPASPNVKITYTFVIGLGFLIPFTIIYVLFKTDNTLYNKKDIAKAVPNAKIIGEIPLISESNTTLHADPNDRSILAEAARILASNVEYTLPKKEKGKGQVILCTSSIQGEGKSFVAMNLSLAMAGLKKKVLLVGADLRNPQLHKYLGLDKKEGGLVNFLLDPSYDWKDRLITGFKENPTHRTLIAGVVPPRPTQLLNNGHLDKLLEEAKKEFDFIILDSAPTLLVTDTLLMGHLVDATVYLCRANHTDKNLLEYFHQILREKKLCNPSFVINGLGPKNAYGYGYGYKYGYNYGYSYGYVEDVKKKKSWKDFI